MPEAKVSKALSQEEQTILANIKSLVDQMESLEAGEADYEEDQQPVEQSMDSDDDAYDEVDKESDEDEVDKAEDEEMTPLDRVMQKVSEGEDLSDEDRKMISSALESIDKSEEEDMPDRKKVDKAAKIEAQNAEDRLEYGKPEETDEAMQAMKALARMILGQRQTAQKSTTRRRVAQKSAPSKELLEMRRLVQKNSRAIESMLEGFGLADEIKKSAPVNRGQEVRKNRSQAPVGNSDGEVVKLLRELVAKSNGGQEKGPEEQDHGTEIRKGLSESLPSIFGVRQ